MSGRSRKTDREAETAPRAALGASIFHAGPSFAASFESLREACRDAFARGPSDDELIDLMLQHLSCGGTESPVGQEMERALRILDFRLPVFDSSKTENQRPRSASPTQDGGERATPKPVVDLVVRFVDELLREHVGKRLSEVAVLDPCAGTGDFLVRLSGKVFANEASLPAYHAAYRRAPGATLGFANPLLLAERGPTASLDFFENENAEIVRRTREAEVSAVVGRAPAKDAERLFRWSVDRLRRADGSPGKGVVAFVTDEPLRLEGTTQRVYRLDLREGWGVVATFLVREAGDFSECRLAEGDPLPERLGDVPWTAPPDDPVEWTEALPLEDGLFRLGAEGVFTGRDAWVWDADKDALLAKVARTAAFYHAESARLAGYAGRNAVRRDEAEIRWTPALEAKLRRKGKIRLDERTVVWGQRRPFERSWLYLDPVLIDRAGPWLRLRFGPCLLVARAPFSISVTNAVPDRRALGSETRGYPLGEGLSPSALARFRTAYGAGVTERNAFDYILALLHHPSYRKRYGEAIRKAGPRVPLLPTEALATLHDVADAPPVGEGTAFGTGWLDPEAFEPGTVPDYDDPFASPYARGDIDPGFLLFAGLGAALAVVQSESERLVPYDLSEIEAAGAGPRLLRRQGRVALGEGRALEGIPQAAFEYEIGGKSLVAWAVERLRTEPHSAAKVVGQAVAAALEIQRLVEVVAEVPFR